MQNSLIIPTANADHSLAIFKSPAKGLNFGPETKDIFVGVGEFPSLQRNLAAKLSDTDLLVFLDDDSTLTTFSVTGKIENLLQDAPTPVLGGPAITHPDAPWLQQCFGELMGSRLGGLKTRARHKPVGKRREASSEEFTLANLIVRRDVFMKECGFQDDLYPGEDPEFLKRLKRKGYKLIYDPELVVYRSRRNSFPAFFKQFFKYGRGRAVHLFKGLAIFDLIFTIPSVFVLYLLSLLFVRNAWCLAPLGLYVCLALISSLKIAIRRRSPLMLPVALLSFFVMHVAYGLGLMSGFLWKGKKIKADPSKIQIYKISGEKLKALSRPATLEDFERVL